MEKPVRIVSNEKIRTFNDKVRFGLEHALNFMMASDEKITIGTMEPFLMPIEAYVSAYKKQSILIKIHAENSFSGELYWFFELNSAIVLGCMMRMMTPSAVEERLAAKTFDASDQDAFGEVGNQLCGILDRAFRTLTKKNIHLRMDFERKVYPEEAIKTSTFLNKEEYVVLLSSVTIPSRGTQKLTLLLPRSLYEVLLNMELALEGIHPKIVLVYTWDEEFKEKIQTEINSRYRKVLIANEADDIFTMVDKERVAAVGIHLKNVGTPFSMQESIWMKRLAGNRTLSKLPYFLTWQNINPQSHLEADRLGLKGASTGSFQDNFLNWVNSIVVEKKL